MSDNPNRRKDDARPAVALQWGDRPNCWTLLLTSPNAGIVGPLGSTWPNNRAELERVDVCVRRSGTPAGVFRTGGEGAATWHQFYPLVEAGTPALRDGEYLYREGTVPKLDNIELYRIQMAGISAASMGHWKEGDTIHPDYDTVPLRDVARLYAKYAELHAAQLSNAARDVLAERWRQVEVEGWTAERDDKYIRCELARAAATYALCSHIEQLKLCGDQVWPWHPDWWKRSDYRRDLVKAGALIVAEIERLDRIAKQAALQRIDNADESDQSPSDAVDAALADAITHGTGAFRVHSDGSTEHVDLQAQNRAAAEIVAFSPPAGVRDALYRDYVVPTKEDPA